jgi:iron-sulfur cluster repair protein YtfE (RIC family)
LAKSNAISILKHDHENVRELLERLKNTTERATKTRVDLLERIEAELVLHMTVEEEIFYPAFRDGIGDKHAEKMYHEAKEEHRAANKVMADLKKTDPSSPAFGGRAKVLAELVTHHADEEEDEMFPMANKHFSSDELEAIGKQMEERKRQLANGKSRRKESRASAS